MTKRTTSGRDVIVSKQRLAEGNSMHQFTRARQGRQRRVAELSGIAESKLSLILQGKQWATDSEIKAIREAVDQIHFNEAKNA